VNDTEGFVAVSDFWNDDADRDEVIDAGDIHVVLFQFLEKSIEVFCPSVDIEDMNAFLVEFSLEKRNDSRDVEVSLPEICLLDFFRQGVVFRIEVLEAEILEFTFELTDAQSVGNLGVYLYGFARDTLLFFPGDTCSSVRMLWRRSASLMMTTRISRAMARNIFRRFSR
jgi:hypothetical protein